MDLKIALELSQPVLINPVDVDIPPGLPAPDIAFLEELKGSIQVLRHMDPIHVTKDAKTGKLTAIQGGGVSRILAARLLEIQEIQAIIWDGNALAARIVGIHKDLVRKHLTTFQQQLLRNELVTLYKELKVLAPEGTASPLIRVLGYKTLQDVAAEVKVGYRTLRNAIQIAQDIHPEVQKEVERAPAVAGSTRKLLVVAQAGDEIKQEMATAAAQSDTRTYARLEKDLIKAQRSALRGVLSRAKGRPRKKRKRSSVDAAAQTRSAPPQATLSVLEGGKQVRNDIRAHEGDWLLVADRHRLFVGGYDSQEFKASLPKLDLAFLDYVDFQEYAEETKTKWNLDWLVKAARTVVIAVPMEEIFRFARTTAMPYEATLRFDLDGDVYGAIIFSHFAQRLSEDVYEANSSYDILATVSALIKQEEMSTVLIPLVTTELLQAANQAGLSAWTAMPPSSLDPFLNACQSEGLAVQESIDSESIYVSS